LTVAALRGRDFDDGSAAHTAARAHGGDADSAVLAAELVDEIQVPAEVAAR